MEVINRAEGNHFFCKSKKEGWDKCDDHEGSLPLAKVTKMANLKTLGKESCTPNGEEKEDPASGGYLWGGGESGEPKRQGSKKGKDNLGIVRRSRKF